MISGGVKGVGLIAEPKYDCYRLVVGPWNWINFRLSDGVSEARDRIWWLGFSEYLLDKAYEEA